MTTRYCLREPIPEIEVAAQRLDDAVTAHLAGDKATADALLRQANDKIVSEWLDSVWGKETIYNRPLRKLDHVVVLTKDKRSVPCDATRDTKRLIHQRDGYFCRFCRIPVIRGELRSAIAQAYPEAVPWGGTNATQHAAFQCMWAQYDHILPHARGGISDLENVYLTCAACNYGRGNYLLDEFDIVHPGSRSPRSGGWDGLERFRLNPG